MEIFDNGSKKCDGVLLGEFTCIIYWYYLNWFITYSDVRIVDKLLWIQFEKDVDNLDRVDETVLFEGVVVIANIAYKRVGNEDRE
jgi:hypothetical protein